MVIQSHENLCFFNVNGTEIQDEESMECRKTDDNENIVRLTDSNDYDENHCIVCDKHFSNANRLLSHQIEKHVIRNDMSTLRPYMCSQCDKSYTTQGSLNIHKLIHSGERIFLF